MSGADLTLPLALMVGIIATVETTMRKSRTIWRSPVPVGDKIGPVGPTGVTVLMSIFQPSREPQISVLADLGGGRATELGFAPLGTDIQSGDELRAMDGTIEHVIGVRNDPDLVVCALSLESV